MGSADLFPTRSRLVAALFESSLQKNPTCLAQNIFLCNRKKNNPVLPLYMEMAFDEKSGHQVYYVEF